MSVDKSGSPSRKPPWSKETVKLITILVFAGISLAAGVIKFYSYYYFLFSIFAAILMVSFLARFLTGKGLDCRRTLVDRVYEDQEILVTLTVVNRGFWPQVLITVADVFDTDFFTAVPEIFFIPAIGPRAEKKLVYKLRCRHRGQYDLGPVKIQYFDPFGIFPIKKINPSISKILVYPLAYDLPDFPFAGGGSSPRLGLETVPKSGGALEFYATREYCRGDSLRLIHWKSSARTGQLIVKEFEKNVATDVTIFMDLYKNQEIGVGSETNIEYSIKVAASLSKYIINRYNVLQLIASSKYMNLLVAAGSGPGHFYEILSHLALVQAVGEKKLPRLIMENYSLLSNKSLVILIFSKLAAVAETLPVLPVLQSKNIRVLGVLMDDRTFAAQGKDQPPVQPVVPPEIFDLISAGAAGILIKYGASIPDQLLKVYQ